MKFTTRKNGITYYRKFLYRKEDKQRLNKLTSNGTYMTDPALLELETLKLYMLLKLMRKAIQ